MLKITDVRAVPGDAAFLMDDGETAVLYDTGFGFTGFAVAKKIKGLLGERGLDYILLTHSHYDHALGSAAIARVFPEAKIIASDYAATIFAKPSARAAMAQLDRKAAEQNGVTDYEDLTPYLRVDIPVRDGDVLRCGKLEFTVIALPGHTKCSVGYYLKQERMLLSCETLGVYFEQETYLPSCLVGCRMTLDSIARARELEIDTLVLPHYGPAGQRAQDYFDRAEQACRETIRQILDMHRRGMSREEIVDFFVSRDHQPHVAPVYPIDAFRLNTGIMVARVETEWKE